jgi:DNA invertase Pin-like site-specific DNA recombinase
MKQPAPVPEGRLIGYARVSTPDQKLDLQLDALRRAGVADDNIHTDQASGVRVTRRGLSNAFRDLRRGDVLVVWRLDRIGRSLGDLLKRLEELERLGVGFRSLTEAIDTTTAAGRLILHIMGAIAEFERQLVRERTAAGMRSAKSRGIRLGAKPKLSPAQLKQAEAMLRGAMTVREVAEKLSVSPGTLYNHFPGGKTALLGAGKIGAPA